MHFWIGTRNQCAYTNRYRVPRLCMQGGREGACARALLLEVARAGASADMAAPVHRFAAVDWPPRPPRHLHRLQSRPVPAVHNSSRVQNDAIFVDIALDRRQRTMASLVPARRGTRDTALRETALELHRSATMARHLKLATLVFIAMAILLLAVIKHGFDRQVRPVFERVSFSQKLGGPRVARPLVEVGADGDKWGGDVCGGGVRVRRRRRVRAVDVSHCASRASRAPCAIRAPCTSFAVYQGDSYCWSTSATTIVRTTRDYWGSVDSAARVHGGSAPVQDSSPDAGAGVYTAARLLRAQLATVNRIRCLSAHTTSHGKRHCFAFWCLNRKRRVGGASVPMHFWIDKRSQCAYTGRHRVPSSLSAGRARGRVCAGAGAGVGGRKGMAAPVHRFAAVDCPPRRPHRHHNRHHNYQPPPVPAVHTSNRRQNDDIYVEIPLEPPQPTIASLAAARSVTPDTLLRSAALGFHHSPMMAPHLKFGMLVSFALATMFLAGAKYYFDKQVVRDNSSGSEATVVCAAVACVCGVGCALSLCRAAPPAPPPFPPDRVSSTARHHQQQQSSEPSEDISLATLLQDRPGPPTESPEAPPPYKIAVLMPGRESPPPPAYSELS